MGLRFSTGRENSPFLIMPGALLGTTRLSIHELLVDEAEGRKAYLKHY
jgi:hypothetical protein